MKEATIQMEPKATLMNKVGLKTKKMVPTKASLGGFLKKTGISFLSMMIFLLVWFLGSSYLFNIEANVKIQKALQDQGAAAATEMEACIKSGDKSCQPNTLPSPVQVWGAFQNLILDHKAISAKKAAFAASTAATNAQRKAQGLAHITYTGRPSFIDQIITSLKTVFVGFLISLLIAVPLGIVMGLNENLRVAFNWLIQIFKPAKVLKLGVWQKIFKVILPSAIPLIFTGMRITVSVAWMVLIAIELLAQSPGLGSFVWEEFQNGANDSKLLQLKSTPKNCREGCDSE